MMRRRLAPTAGVASCTAIPPSHTVTRFPPICEELPVPAARAAGTGPSVPGSGPGSEAFQERVFAREQAEGDWNLSASSDTELLAQDVTVRLGRPRRDAQTLANLLVREPCGDQLDYLSLPLGQLWRDACQDLVHADDANNGTPR